MGQKKKAKKKTTKKKAAKKVKRKAPKKRAKTSIKKLTAKTEVDFIDNGFVDANEQFESAEELNGLDCEQQNDTTEF